MTFRLYERATLPLHVHLPLVFILDLRSGREVPHLDQRRQCRRRSSLPAVLLVPDDPIVMTPPPPPNTNTTGATGAAGAAGAASSSTLRGSLAGPFPAVDSAEVLQITPVMLQQLLASAIAASATGGHREPPVPKFWESEPAAWFQVFWGHYQPHGLTQLALFNALLPLVPTSAVGSTAPEVFDCVECFSALR